MELKQKINLYKKLICEFETIFTLDRLGRICRSCIEDGLYCCISNYANVGVPDGEIKYLMTLEREKGISKHACSPMHCIYLGEDGCSTKLKGPMCITYFCSNYLPEGLYDTNEQVSLRKSLFDFLSSEDDIAANKIFSNIKIKINNIKLRIDNYIKNSDLMSKYNISKQLSQ